MTIGKQILDFMLGWAEWNAVKAEAAKVPKLEARIAALESRLMGGAGPVCDSCGTASLTRIGSRPNPTFGRLGVKDAIYRCNVCNVETTVITER